MGTTAERQSLLDLAADAIALALTLRQLPERPAPDRLRAAAIARLDAFAGAAARAGAPPPDVENADFALAALLDEIVCEVRGATADAWRARPLAGERHGEAEPGAAFFTRLDVIAADATHRSELLEVYVACLLLGYGGRMADDPDALLTRTEGALAAVRAARGPLPSLAGRAIEDPA